MKLICDYVMTCKGSVEVDLSDIDDLSQDEIDGWIMEGAEMEVHDKTEILLSPRYTPEDLAEAVKAEMAERGEIQDG